MERAMKNPQIKKFKGLNNVEDPLRLGLSWLRKADNVLVTSSGALTRRDGYAKTYAATLLAGAYTTRDYRRCYAIDNGTLLRIYPDMTTGVLRTGLSNRDVFWTEVNEQVYFANGVDAGIITVQDTVLDWRWSKPGTPTLAAMTGKLDSGTYQVACTFVLPDGRETGACASVTLDLPPNSALQITGIPQQAGAKTRVYIAPANSPVFQLAYEGNQTAVVWNTAPEWLGIELLTHYSDPLPARATMPVFWQGRMHAVEHFEAHNTSVVWRSEPLGFHLFPTSDNFIPVPGRIHMVAAHEDALIIGTENAIYAFADDKLTELADYGVVPGHHVALQPSGDDRNKILFWSQRGVCRAMPFENLTEDQISVNCGLTAGGTLVHKDGQAHYIVALQKGGDAFNPRSE
jgi:hypothetical protein